MESLLPFSSAFEVPSTVLCILRILCPLLTPHIPNISPLLPISETCASLPCSPHTTYLNGGFTNSLPPPH
ncbi:MAG: hypothetical protein NZL93_04280, partial [Chthoniobacterales bacterium]|nr:hypothetical protein [Chthoniobacterales bacterium]